MTEFVILSTTCGTAEEAERIASQLIDKQLAACVQIVSGVQSVYRWEGKVERAAEWLCLIKTRRNLLTEAENTIKQLHSYDCPEIVATAIEAASATYQSWLNAQLLSK